MYHPLGYSDSNNIIILDNIAYYCCNGSTYLDKLKNGISLDYVFKMEDNIENDASMVSQSNTLMVDENTINVLYIDYDLYKQLELQVKTKMKYYKHDKLKNKKKKYKRPNIKLNGNDYKHNVTDNSVDYIEVNEHNWWEHVGTEEWISYTKWKWGCVYQPGCF
jgi:hypothetical protein